MSERLSSRDGLAQLIWSEIAGSGQRQCDVARVVGITEKHLSRTVQGRAGMQLDMVDRVLAACRRRLVLSTVPLLWSAWCPACMVERADYEGPGLHLPECPNCGSAEDPEVPPDGDA